MVTLVDVQELIEALQLSEDLADQFRPFVRTKYKEIWTVVHSNPP